MDDTPDTRIQIELVYARPNKLTIESLRVAATTTVGQAIEQSGILRRHPDIATDPLAVGIFGCRAELSRPLRDFDRIEIYRPLIADPKHARRQRARRTRASKR
jgi:putative ubiquitin-RnfH superfamily antitoxin RatB of RatAB toxin-antitoxin module